MRIVTSQKQAGLICRVRGVHIKERTQQFTTALRGLFLSEKVNYIQSHHGIAQAILDLYMDDMNVKKQTINSLTKEYHLQLAALQTTIQLRQDILLGTLF